MLLVVGVGVGMMMLTCGDAVACIVGFRVVAAAAVALEG